MVGTYTVAAISGSCGFLLGGTLYGYYLCCKAHKKKKNVYETSKLVDEYMYLHYGSPQASTHADWYNNFQIKDGFDFPLRCAIFCDKYCPKEPRSTESRRALDIGCAVGRSTFELSQYFEEVIGIDYSQAFIDQCLLLKEKKILDFSIVSEGDIYEKHTTTLSSSVNVDRVKFQVGDACNLPKTLGKFDCVLAANLICRLYDSMLFIKRLPELVKENGILVLTAPYTWLTSFTPKVGLLFYYILFSFLMILGEGMVICAVGTFFSFLH
ncbi:probable S-adenosylmethionine-dependent methyltransferase CRG1 isoform X1 [Octopus vulgaris]|uniref:Probable S-adenosylmethionine-dependent methyltransferase CRG1 isoform X1 n=1 Tax=Octopus vulgaris TaxID=6645 RepID=A0AA36F2G3_OCTVU|nr:probable S-adenosylmethionine-dependent methyltransferase CRG1 isoform X1 [Octopus vulgaris]